VHWLLHRAHGSRIAPLAWAGGLHATHHDFLDRELRVHDELVAVNLRRHVVPEFLTQAAFSGALLALLWRVPLLPWTAVAGAFAIQVLVFGWILKDRGLDVNHRGHDRLDAFRDSFFCMPEYHALHHVYPDAHFSSWIKALDYALGSGLSLTGRRVAWLDAGEGDEAANALRRRVEAAGAVSVPRDDAPDGAPGEAPGIVVVAGDPETPAIASALRDFVMQAGERRMPSEVWWLRQPGEARRLPELGRRIQLRRLDRDPRRAADASAARWMAALRRGHCRA
jgi:hypothetical protein